MLAHGVDDGAGDAQSTNSVEAVGQELTLIAFSQVGLPDLGGGRLFCPGPEEAAEVPAAIVMSHVDRMHREARQPSVTRPSLQFVATGARGSRGGVSRRGGCRHSVRSVRTSSAKGPHSLIRAVVILASAIAVRFAVPTPVFTLREAADLALGGGLRSKRLRHARARDNRRPANLLTSPLCIGGVILTR